MKYRDKLFLIILMSYIVVISTGIFLGGKSLVSIRENRRLSHFESISISGYFDESTQENIESSMMDQFAKRDELIQFTTEIEKMLFYKFFYPITIYGDVSIEQVSDQYFIFNNETIVEKYVNYEIESKITNDNEYIKRLVINNSKFQNELSKLVSEYYIYEPFRSKYLYDQYTNNNDLNKMYSIFLEHLDKSIPIKRMEVKSLYEYQKYYFHNDHHYNNVGQKYFYDGVLKMMNIDPNSSKVKFSSEHCIPNFDFYGSYNRVINNYNYSDKYCLYKYEINSPYLWNGETKEYNEYRNKIINGNEFETPYLFTTEIVEQGTISFHNGNKNLLVIGDSFVSGINFPLASNFNNMHIISYNHFPDIYLSEYIKENSIDIILMMPTYMQLYLREQNFKI